jgi:hypothetical protein
LLLMLLLRIGVHGGLNSTQSVTIYAAQHCECRG